MSGEQRLRIATILFLVLACFVLVLASGAAAEEGEGDNEGENEEENGEYLRELLNENQNANGSWDECMDITVGATLVNSYSSYDADFVVTDGMKWIESNYEDENYNVTVTLCYGGSSKIVTAGIQTQAFILKIDVDDDVVGWSELQMDVKGDLVTLQDEDGSWNNDVGDTALATDSLAEWEDSSENYEKGIEWLQEYEDPKTHSWGSVDDDSKAIMALDSAGVDIWDEIAALMLKQKPDGSFGGIEETSWAVIALSTNPNEETMLSMDKAVAWLRDQEYDNNQDLALAALAEQYYEDAKFKEERGGGTGSGTGFIPPPWMYVLSFLIIGSIILSYQLFARLERDGILDGPRKDIYQYVTDHPGEHQANITKTLGLSSSSIRYHLSVLESMDLIVNHKNGKYKRFYTNKNGYSKYTNGNGYKDIMSALKNNTARNIVKFLLSHPKSNQKKVSCALDIHPSTVTWHAKRLEEAEIISKHRKGKEIHYALNSDVQLRKVIGIIEGSPA